ncbi:hypothetical protein [Loktanella sp. 3ANDIMAR09]|uniref:hypothetical protein n=1 Tax=Loktanella sp. 3ANDIMAR09 TaxID=1225657 RepID=UPI0012EE0B0F|nr:hypothetical protein [Loktanella sp. 3ANDIMAR09]
MAILIAFLAFSLFTNAALLVSDSIRDAIRSAVVRPLSSLDTPDRRRTRAPDIEELRTRNVVLGQQLDDLKLDNDSLQTRNARLASQLDDVALDNRRLNAELRRTASDLAENRVARARAADIAAGMAQRTQRSIAKNFGSMAAETLPFIGAAAVVGFTAAEVYDACQSLRDVRELNALFDGTVIEEIPACGYSLKELQHVMLGNTGLADCSVGAEMRDPICDEPPSLNNPVPTEQTKPAIEPPARL